MGLFDSLIKSAVNSIAGDAASAIVKNAAEQAAAANAPKAEPDCPVAFGDKAFACWYAVKGETPQTVIRKLGLRVLRESGWADGIRQILDENNNTDCLFVSPKLGDYVLVISLTKLGLDERDNSVIKRNANLFSELQTFGWADGVSYNHYAKYVNGQVVSAYLITDNGIFKSGSLTPEERELGFDRFINSRDEYPEDYDIDGPSLTPFNRDICAIAKAWGVDPNFTDNKYEKGVGFICK